MITYKRVSIGIALLCLFRILLCTLQSLLHGFDNSAFNSIVISIVVLVLLITVSIARALAKPHGKVVSDAEKAQLEGIALPFLVEQSEKVLVVLGGGYLKNLLTGAGAKNGIAVVTNKRVYFKGACYYMQRTKWKRRNEERVVDLKDVTATGMVHTKNWGVLLWLPVLVLVEAILINISMHGDGDNLVRVAIFSILLILVVLIFIGVIIYFIFKRRILFEIAFAGGKIGFNTAWYSQTEVDDFQKQLRQAKDKISKETVTVGINSTIQNNSTGSVEELSKYATLLENGHITQEEYNELKKKWLQKAGI